MVEQSVKMIASQGFHMRPASEFVGKMAKFVDCEIKLIVGDKQIDAKSLMNILAAGIKAGTDILVRASGKDEQKAVDEAIDMIKTGFGE